MNERIKELAKEAGYQEDGFGFGHWDMAECEKFAELLVRECIDICESGTSTQTTSSGAADLIKQRFGVK